MQEYNRKNMIEAMKEHARGHIAKHKMNVEVYFRNAAGIGGESNADILEAIEKELDIVARYDDQIAKWRLPYSSDHVDPFLNSNRHYRGNHNDI